MSEEFNFNKKTFDQVVTDQIDKEKSKPAPKRDEPGCWARINDDCKNRLLGAGCCLVVVLVFALILINQGNGSNVFDQDDPSPSHTPTSSLIPTYIDDQQQVTPPTPSSSVTPSLTHTPHPTMSVTSTPTPSPLSEDDKVDSDFLELELSEVILGVLGFSALILFITCCYCKCKRSHDQHVRVAPRQIVYDVEH